MNRRDALERVSMILGVSIIGGTAFLQGCKPMDKKTMDGSGKSLFTLSAEQIAFLDEIADTIIPTTDTPGAKAAKVGSFMNTMVADCYKEADQKIFVDGIAKIDEASKKANGKGFMEAGAQQRTSLLSELNKQLKAYNDTKKDGDPNHYFGMMKQLTLLGYFTSEIGATQALRYIAVPGKFQGCVPYAKGDKAWA
jgi:hypothetical protein